MDGANGIITDCIFNNNKALNGGAVSGGGINSRIIGSTFNNNNASIKGGAIYWTLTGFMANCSFTNTKWINNAGKSNGICINSNLTISGGNGIVDLNTNTNSIISGISIIVLNNETYYYPPGTNINFIDKGQKQ